MGRGMAFFGGGMGSLDAYELRFSLSLEFGKSSL